MAALFQFFFHLLIVASILTRAAADGVENRFTPIQDPFLGKIVSTRAKVKDTIEKTLQSIYRADTEDRLNELRKELAPTFLALPKTEFGLLSSASTRYLLHRHFLRSRAWVVNGLAPDGEFWNASSPLAPLPERSGTASELFRQRLRVRGLSLDEIALLAAMIENHLHQIAVGRLRKVWLSLRKPNLTTLNVADAETALQAYVASYMVSPKANLSQIEKVFGWVEKSHPIWPKTKRFLRKIVQSSIGPVAGDLTFTDVERLVVDISEHYGVFQAEDCKSIKDALVSAEGPRAGRVPLEDFYKANLDGAWQFSESVPYMRYAGILEESPGPSLSVLIPNYFSSPSQQVARSDEYAVTCLDECEAILAMLEGEVSGPLASPVQVTSLLQKYSTGTNPARAEWPEELTDRLRSIAEAHGGNVPLHGRLFALFLHHAFPRECAYPFVAGKAHPLTIEAFQKVTKLRGLATRGEIRRFAFANLSGHASTAGGLPTEGLPWDDIEELVDVHRKPHSLTVAELVGPVMSFAAAITVLLLLLPSLTVLRALFKGLVQPCGVTEGLLPASCGKSAFSVP